MKHVINAATALFLWASLVCMADSKLPAHELPFLDCQGQYPEGLIGVWRIDYDRTDETPFAGAPGVESLDSSGDTALDLTTIEFMEDRIVFSHPRLDSQERSYIIRHANSNKFEIEFVDETGATESQNAELVPCGLVLEHKHRCVSEFCRNYEEETQRLLLPDIGKETYEQIIKSRVEKHMARRAREKGFTTRVYYRQVGIPQPRIKAGG